MNSKSNNTLCNDSECRERSIRHMFLYSTMKLVIIVLMLSCGAIDAFSPRIVRQHMSHPTKSTSLKMGLDLVTYIRTEWISAALCTNQTPRSADICLQLGVEDGRAVTFIPRTIRELITSSAEPDGKLTISARRQLKQQQERRKAATVTYVDQRCDDLRETPDESVDVVISLQAASRMLENGLDWKKSIKEAARVLKPGGRLLFVEQTELAGESYLDFVENLCEVDDNVTQDGNDDRIPIFEVGFDEVDLVLIPHIAGVAIKSEDAGLTSEELSKREEEEKKDRLAELSIAAYERGIKKRRKKKANNANATQNSTGSPKA